MNQRSLQFPALCLVTDRGACRGRPLETVVADSAAAGLQLLQLRDRDLPPRELLALGKRLKDSMEGSAACLVVNDRVDVAMALGADGVHLGGGSLPAREVRRLVGGSMLVGVSVHSLEESIAAEGEGADYLLLGTIFATPSHPGKPPAGLSLISEAARSVSIPIIAIGGIDTSNAGSVIAAGASGVAVLRAIQSAPDVASATRALLRSIQGENGQSPLPLGEG